MSSKAAGKKRAQSPESEDEHEHEREEEIDLGSDDETPLAGDDSEVKDKVASSSRATSKPVAKKRKQSEKRKSAKSAGIVYISRLPPGMTPQKVKHLMARWGEVGKIYAQKKDAPTGYNPDSGKSKKKEKHAAANYSEAWVEFLDKSVAKTVAKMLNAQVIGGKKGDKWSDDIWTMKYLSGFKWEMLGEQVAYERQAHQARLRNEITQSRAVQGEYLRNVELARVLDKRRAKKAESDPAGTSGQEMKLGKSGETGGEGAGKEKEKEGMKGRYRQREAVDRASGLEKKGMDSVLGSVFG